MNSNIKLGVNLDHIATIRNARGLYNMDLLRGARIAQKAGADNITAHLREDRRHMNDTDIFCLKNQSLLPLNLEIAVTEEMQRFALNIKPYSVCFVPEKREELTTEGGLDIQGNYSILGKYITELQSVGIIVSLFLEPDKKYLENARNIGVQVVELHTGKYCKAENHTERFRELEKIRESAIYGQEIGLEIHAGHGLNYQNIHSIVEISAISEVNIGHFLINESIFTGLYNSIQKMRSLIKRARSK